MVKLKDERAALEERIDACEVVEGELKKTRDDVFDESGGVAIGAFPSHGSNTIQVWRGSIMSWSRGTPVFIEKEKAPSLESSMGKALETLKQLELLGIVKSEDRLVYYVPTGEHLERADGAEWKLVE